MKFARLAIPAFVDSSPLSFLRESLRLQQALARIGLIGLPKSFWQLLRAESFSPPPSEKIAGLLGGQLLELFNGWGPIYGKAAQMGLSRLSAEQREKLQDFDFDRFFGSWPPLDQTEIETILDSELPEWRHELRLEGQTLGVASMAHVVLAKDLSGKTWAIKILKPWATQRLGESLAALEQGLRLLKPLAKTKESKRLVRELRSLSKSLKEEADLSLERKHIEKMHEVLLQKKADILRIPELHPSLHSKKVLVLEYFQGTPLPKLLKDIDQVPEQVRKTFAKKLLSEFLLHIFEIGVFHADPHAGNLILLEDGSLGLCDWGLQGRLADKDRKHIAALLKAIIALDMERLKEALRALAKDEGIYLSEEKLNFELSKLTRILKQHQAEGTKPRFHELMEHALRAAKLLEISLPEGLLMMSKSLLTIEGLAKGIDPDLSFLKVASPVLFKAADPNLQDMLALLKNAPKLITKLMGTP